MTVRSYLAIALAGAIIAVSGAATAQDFKAGSKVFNKCKACHTLVAGKNRLGPSLHGMFGRAAGTVKKYRYSKAMKKAGSGGLVWTDKTVDQYLLKPKKFIPKNKMAFSGLKRKKDRDNLIAYLKKATSAN